MDDEFNRHVCEEFTQWVKMTATYSREPVQGRSQDHLAFIESRRVEFTRTWQERKCTICGRTQQEDLTY